ncbi:type II toxin-antitoxin system HicB family antitoxin [Lactococcus petauri]|uniref:type II toxin-antitoxin system HicB family antitoxin n=1 Tax=Lactococcus petauri TaxID=1940789 RepID=UPI00129EDF33|nr:type II toxin-antitoxin system HicB family antitoxin [Lactococcus petauri]
MVNNTPLLVAYPAIFHPEENGGYFIEFPDVDGAFTGINENNLAFGLEMAEEVLGMVLADYIESGEKIPQASPISNIKATTEDIVTLVKVDMEKYFKDISPVKKTLSIPKWADEMGKRSGINFSRLLTDAIANAARTFEVETDSDKEYLTQK